ncbi:MAG: hypothetical protein Aurels2KO_56450 [Aureliella sp.]
MIQNSTERRGAQPQDTNASQRVADMAEIGQADVSVATCQLAQIDRLAHFREVGAKGKKTHADSLCASGDLQL